MNIVFKDKEKHYIGGTMKGSHIMVVITACLILSLFLFGCGGGAPGVPGSCGNNDTGIDPRVGGVSHTHPPGDTGELWLIDLVQSDCEGDPEEWGDDYAYVIFVGIPLYTDITDNRLYITNYRVTFDPLSPEYPPIDEIRAGVQGSYFVIPNAESNPYPFLIFDFGRKFEIQDVISRGIYPPNFPLLYNMTIEMWGQDQYGQDFCVAPIIRVIEVANYNNC
jgi:hypothetical protein